MDFLIPINVVAAYAAAITIFATVYHLRKIKRPWWSLLPKILLGVVSLFAGTIYLSGTLLGPSIGPDFITRNSALFLRPTVFMIFVAIFTNSILDLMLLTYAKYRFHRIDWRIFDRADQSDRNPDHDQQNPR